MRKFQSAVLVFTLLFTFETSSASQLIRLGGSCTKLNQVGLSGSTKLVCIKLGKKLVWGKAVNPTTKNAQNPISPQANPASQSEVAPISQKPSTQTWEVVSPPTGVISIYTGAKPTVKKNVKKSFELTSPLAGAKNTSNLKLWIYDPENQNLPLGSPGVYLQKNGGAWNFVARDRTDGGFDTLLEPGRYVMDIVEPNGNSAKYERGRYLVKVDDSGSVSIDGLEPNRAGYFTVTAVVKASPSSVNSTFQPSSSCQLQDKTGSPSMSNGFPRAIGRLPSHGIVKALIIPVEFSDLKGTGSPAEVYREMAKGTADFYYKESQKSLRFEFTTLSSYIDLKVPVGSFKLGSYNSGDPTSYLQAGLAAVENEIDISNFDIAYVLPPSSVRPDQIAYGPAFPGVYNSNNYQNATGRILNASVGGADAWQNFPGAGWKWMAHETGHTFGLYDWYTLDGTNPYGPWDIMSLNWSTEAIELNAWNRYITGWLADSQVHCKVFGELTSTGTTFTLEAIGADSTNPKAVMVKLSDSKILVAEARATAGLDKLDPNQSGVLVYVVDTSIPTIKGMARTYSRADVDSSLRNAPLKVGEKISVLGVNVFINSSSNLNYEVTFSK